MHGENQTRRRLKRSLGEGRPSRSVISGMQNELRTHILVILNERIASTPEIARELGVEPEKVRYELQALKRIRPPLVELVDERPVRGTVEKFYRATAAAMLDQAEWSGVPESIKDDMRAKLLNMIVEDAVAAIAAGTYDSVEDAHMSWVPLLLDQQGWKELNGTLAETLGAIERIKEASAGRLVADDKPGISCTVSMLGYASANEKRRVAPPAIRLDDEQQTSG